MKISRRVLVIITFLSVITLSSVLFFTMTNPSREIQSVDTAGFVRWEGTEFDEEEGNEMSLESEKVNIMGVKEEKKESKKEILESENINTMGVKEEKKESTKVEETLEEKEAVTENEVEDVEDEKIDEVEEPEEEKKYYPENKDEFPEWSDWISAAIQKKRDALDNRHKHKDYEILHLSETGVDLSELRADYCNRGAMGIEVIGEEELFQNTLQRTIRDNIGNEYIETNCVSEYFCSYSQQYYSFRLLMKVWDAYMKKLDIRYFIYFGTGLSVHRERGNPIPYDADIDIMVDRRDFHKLERIPFNVHPRFFFRLNPQYTQPGPRLGKERIYCGSYCGFPMNAKLYISLKKGHNDAHILYKPKGSGKTIAYIDVFSYYVREEKNMLELVIPQPNSNKFPLELWYPVKPCTVFGIDDLPCPNNMTAVLEVMYGSDLQRSESCIEKEDGKWGWVANPDWSKTSRIKYWYRMEDRKKEFNFTR